MNGSESERYVVISADGHCGADVWDYKPYLESKYHDDFDRWAHSYHDAWEDIDAELRAGDIRLGASSAEAPLNWESAARLALTESQGVSAEVLFPNTSPPFMPSGSVTAPGPRNPDEYEHRFAGIKAHNRWLADFCNVAPGRRAGLAQVFLDDIDAAIAEVTWAREAGLKGVLLPGDHVLKLANLYYPALDPFWAACAELDLPVHRHSLFPCEHESVGGVGAHWVGSLEIRFFTLRALSHLLCAGVFERHPRLKFVTTELGHASHIPEYVGRLDSMWSAEREGRGGSMPLSVKARSQLTRAPSDYFATNCYVGGALDLREACRAGVPNLMFGTDLPHSEGTAPFTREALRVMLSDTPEDEVRDVLYRRAASVYDFDLDLLQGVADRIGPTVGDVATPLPQSEWPAYPTESFCRVFETTPDLRGVGV